MPLSVDLAVAEMDADLAEPVPCDQLGCRVIGYEAFSEELCESRLLGPAHEAPLLGRCRGRARGRVR